MIGSGARMRTRLFVGGLAAATAAFAWLPGLRHSLWLDETVTAWVCRAPLVESLARAVDFQFSALAFLPHWMAGRVAAGEPALRAPALLFMACAAVVVWRVGRRLGDDEAGLLAALAFVGLRIVGTQAANARPYALGVLVVTAAMLFLLRWLGGGHARDGAAWALLAGLMPHVHPLLGVMLPVHAATLVVSWRRRGAPPAVRPALLLLLLVLALLVPQARSLAARSGSMTYAPLPTFDDLAVIVAPPAAVAGALLAWAGARAAGGRLAGHEGGGPPWGVLLAWAVVPAALLFLVSRLTPMRFLVPHYAIAGAPGLALLIGFALRALEPARARLVAAVVLAAAGASATAATLRPLEDWRQAAAAVRSETAPDAPVVVMSGLVESADARWLLDPRASRYLMAPLMEYPVERALVPMPWRMDEPPLAAYVGALVGALRDRESFVLIARGDGSGPEAWLRDQLGAPWRVRRLPVRGVHVSVFSRANGPAR